jgi:hypothetical protein
MEYYCYSVEQVFSVKVNRVIFLGIFAALVVLLFLWGGFSLRRKSVMYMPTETSFMRTNVELEESFSIE